MYHLLLYRDRKIIRDHFESFIETISWKENLYLKRKRKLFFTILIVIEDFFEPINDLLVTLTL